MCRLICFSVKYQFLSSLWATATVDWSGPYPTALDKVPSKHWLQRAIAHNATSHLMQLSFSALPLGLSNILPLRFPQFRPFIIQLFKAKSLLFPCVKSISYQSFMAHMVLPTTQTNKALTQGEKKNRRQNSSSATIHWKFTVAELPSRARFFNKPYFFPFHSYTCLTTLHCRQPRCIGLSHSQQREQSKQSGVTGLLQVGMQGTNEASLPGLFARLARAAMPCKFCIWTLFCWSPATRRETCTTKTQSSMWSLEQSGKEAVSWRIKAFKQPDALCGVEEKDCPFLPRSCHILQLQNYKLSCCGCKLKGEMLQMVPIF